MTGSPVTAGTPVSRAFSKVDERKKERRPGGQKGEKRDTDRRKKGKTKLSQGILLFSETPVRNQAKT